MRKPSSCTAIGFGRDRIVYRRTHRRFTVYGCEKRRLLGPPFSISMEWTGRQQLWFLLQSVGFGFVEGLLLDMVTSFVPPVRRSGYLWTDLAFGPFAAVVTFFGALVIMDGQLHPLLLFGVFFGMCIEHISVGIFMHKILWKVRQKMRRMCEVFIRGSVYFRRVRLYDKKFSQKVEKQ